jgi:hypothetical protein
MPIIAQNSMPNNSQSDSLSVTLRITWRTLCCRAQIPAHRFAIDPQLARNPSLRPSTIGQAVNRCLRTHFEDIRHGPVNPFVPGPMELFCVP